LPGVLAPVVGKIVDRSHPRPIIGFGFATLAGRADLAGRPKMTPSNTDLAVCRSHWV